MNTPKSTIVIKFGGTSVATRGAILSIVQIVKIVKSLRRGYPIVVVSAVRGVTEILLAIAKSGKKKKEIDAHVARIREVHGKLINELFSGDAKSEVAAYLDSKLGELSGLAQAGDGSPSASDELASYGEIISSYMISKVLRVHGIASEQVIASKMIITDANFGQAEFLPKETARCTSKLLRKLVKRGVVPVVTGFIGRTKNGRVTTLGRGGSDYSAAIIGYALGSKEIQIWTDVDGIYTADPRTVKNARLIPEISYREASEMAAFGARVLHPRTMRPAIEKNIPVRVLNTFHPSAEGTLISPKVSGAGLKAIAFKKKVVLLTVYSAAMLFSRGFLARVFETLAAQNISVDLVSVSEVSVSVTLDNNDSNGNLERAVSELQKISRVTVHGDYGVISLIGEEIASHRDLLRSLSVLFSKNKIPIRMISMGASDINISLVLPAQFIERAARLVHDKILRGRN